MKINKKIILKGKRIILRPMKLSDAKDYVLWFKDLEVVHYLGNKLLNIKLEDVKKYIKSTNKDEGQLLFAIIAEDGKHIGNTALRFFKDDKRAGLGLVIGDKNYWGNGYAGEIVNLLGDYIFKKLKFERFDLVVFSQNKRAFTAYKKIGFKKEGTLRNYTWNWIDKEMQDQYVMSILKNEWLNK